VLVIDSARLAALIDAEPALAAAWLPARQAYGVSTGYSNPPARPL
jgi:hypothetical protein